MYNTCLGIRSDNDCLPKCCQAIAIRLLPGSFKTIPPNTAYMEFSKDEITQQVAHTARDFAAQYIKPYVMEWDEKQEFPRQLFIELGHLGMMGVLVPEEYGGSGLSYIEYVTIIQ